MGKKRMEQLNGLSIYKVTFEVNYSISPSKDAKRLKCLSIVAINEESALQGSRDYCRQRVFQYSKPIKCERVSYMVTYELPTTGMNALKEG